VRITHVGGPAALIELDGWRLLTDPTFDAPGRRYAFGWDTSSRELAGPAIPASERELAAAPQEVRWLPIGEPVEL
jgi:L-ascorbate metabolism protein UlaG (beta-lactamase superfamily)